MTVVGHPTVERIREISAACRQCAEDLLGDQARPNPVAIARREVERRRRREALFGADLFGDPAWDLLLDLLIAEDGGHALSVSTLCIGAAMPAAAALRWIKVLAEADLIHLAPHPREGRGELVRLAPEASARLKALLSGL